MPSRAAWSYIHIDKTKVGKVGSSGRHHPSQLLHLGHVATDMSVNHPAHPLSPSSQPSLTGSSARPSTSSRPSDQSVRTSDDHPIDEAPPQHASPITTSAHDATEDTSHQLGEAYEEGADHHQPFQPFFTLIEDAHTSDHYHPTVHYIFSDDDTDIVTEAALRSLEAQHDALSGSKREGRTTEPSHSPAAHSDNDKPALLPPRIPGVRDNYIVLDMEPVPASAATATATTTTAIPDPSTTRPGTAGADGTKSMSTSPANPSALAAQTSPGLSVPQTQYRVTSAKSFSPSWQVLHSEMVPAPTFETHEPSDSPGHGLMLKIHGTAGIPGDAGNDKGERGTSRLEDMMEQFAKRMRELQMVIDAADAAPTEGGDQVEEGQELLEQKTTTDEHTVGDEAVKQEDAA